VIAHTYYENVYGEWLDGLNKGLATDRFEVEWWIKSARVEKTLDGQRQQYTVKDLLTNGAAPILHTTADGRGLLHFTSMSLDLDADTLILEFPGEFQQIKAASMDLAKAWRMETRAALETYFARGYRVAEFLTEKEADIRRNYYVFVRAVPDLDETEP
jgi:predicted GNAT superfamily acetyltransferase